MKKLKWMLLVVGLSGFIAGCTQSDTADVNSHWRANLNTPATAEMKAADDGPYAFYRDNYTLLDLYWVCADQVIERRQPVSELIPVECGYRKPISAGPPAEVLPQVRFSANKVAALSDIHGQFEILLGLLQANHLITDTWDWNFGDGHLVIAGDVFDRGPQQTEALWLLYQLDKQAQAAGGRVHMLLGNHETMVLYDDLRYLNDKYHHVAERLEKRFPELYGTDTVLGAWLHSRPVIVKVNNILFMHGGLHPDYEELGLSIAEINEHYRASLGVPRRVLMETPVLDFIYGSMGPLWYRGYFRDRDPITSEQIDHLLKSLSVGHIVVGHTSFPGVFQHWDGRVINVDSDIKRGQSGEILFWEDGEFTLGTLDGTRMVIPDWIESH
ncbi:MAG: metallophosphoesterase [Aliidiomarina sp.]|uniref:metallophosphoesterase n=1 Tax=Aliidiomarina sp. TaxID=1872439 RepID=UPI0025C4776A|nr:metallophosphoesterase [Aliidiomarina sp.]MCH8501168.1 metallophosphoesterase [Aliidiomarina sp.]